jgi:recombinational DNA repair protein (RecF pathway)
LLHLVRHALVAWEHVTEAILRRLMGLAGSDINTAACAALHADLRFAFWYALALCIRRFSASHASEPQYAWFRVTGMN